MKVIYPITLDVKKTTIQKKISAFTGEGGERQLVITLVSGNDKINLTTETVSIVGVKPDGTEFANAAEINDNGQITYTLTTQNVAVVGDVDCQVRVLTGSTVLYSAKFVIDVEENLSDEDAETSSNEWTELIAALQEVENLSVKMFKDEGVPTTDPSDFPDIAVGNFYFDETNLKLYYASVVGETVTWQRLTTKAELDTLIASYYTKTETDTLLSGKQDKIDSSHKLSADNVDDTSTTHKFVTASDKTNWNAKADQSTTYSKTETDNLLSNKANVSQVVDLQSNKQDKLIAGANISIASDGKTISSSSSTRFEVVETLPTSDIRTDTIYLVPKSTSQTNNVYDEYAYINNAWEKIGDTDIDLSGYQTLLSSTNKLNPDYITQTSSKNFVSANQITAWTDYTPRLFVDNDHSTPTTSLSDYSGAKVGDVLLCGTYFYYCRLVSTSTIEWIRLAWNSDLSNYQPLIDSTHKLSADLISAGTNNQVVPISSSTESGKYLKVKSDGTLEWASGGGGGTSYTAGDGIDITSDTISVDLKSGTELQITSGELDIDLSDYATTTALDEKSRTWFGTDTSDRISDSSGDYDGIAVGDLYVVTVNYQSIVKVVTSVGESQGVPYFDVKPVDNTIVSSSARPNNITDHQGHNIDLGCVWVDTTNSRVSILKSYTGTASETVFNWIDLSSGGSYSAGDGIDITNGTISVDIKSGSALTITSGELDVDLSDKQDTIDSTHKLSADLVDDTSATNKFVPSHSSTESGKVLGVDSQGGLNWVAQSGGTTYSGGDGIDITNDTISVDLKSGTELQITSGELDIDLSNYATTTSVSSKEDKTTINTDTSSTTPTLALANNTEQRYTQDLTSLTLTLPQTTPSDFITSVVFASGTTPTSATYDSSIKWSGDDVTSNAFVPVASKTYNIVFWFDGININAVVRGV